MPVGHAHYIHFVLLWIFSFLRLFRMKKQIDISYVGHYCCVTWTESSCFGDSDLIGAGEKSLSPMQRVNSLVLDMRCYRTGDAFFKEEWNSAWTQLYIMVIFRCLKLLGISGGFLADCFDFWGLFFLKNIILWVNHQYHLHCCVLLITLILVWYDSDCTKILFFL